MNQQLTFWTKTNNQESVSERIDTRIHKSRSHCRRFVVAILLSLLTILLPVWPEGAPQVWADATTFILTNTLFGPDETILIDTGILTRDCDFIYTTSDIYVVPSGSASAGANLRGLDPSGAPNTIIGAGGGIFVSETIGFTVPGGTIGSGDWDIVEDTCQNGLFDGSDSVMSSAFTVDIPQDVPSLPASNIAALKARALEQKLKWEEIHDSCKWLFRIADAMGIYGMLTSPRDAILWLLQQSIMAKLGGINPQAIALQAALNTASHYGGIAADPPDPDFRRLSPLGGRAVVDPRSNDPLTVATAHLGTALHSENELLQALLASLERYQGADEAGDGEWALIHARAIKQYADLLATQLLETSAAAAEMEAVLLADTQPFDAVAADVAALSSRLATSGFNADELREARNLNLTQADLDDMKTNLLEVDVASFSKAGLLSQLSDIQTNNTALIGDLTGLSTAMDVLIAGLASDPLVDDSTPEADAGGPYAGDEGAPMSFDGAGSTSPSGITTYEWDLDGDGEFDDASGPTPVFTYENAFTGMVGLKVTNAESLANIAYAAIAVADVNRRPIINTFAPSDRAPMVETLTATSFSLSATDPDGDPLSIDWSVDATPAFTGTPFSYSPTDADIGLHRIEAVVTEDSPPPVGGPLSQIWFVSVFAPDADADGWHANVDCDDSDPAVNPGMTEITGNGKDDDCDSGTPDAGAPPVADDLTVTTEKDTPVAITLSAVDPDGMPLSFTIEDPPDNGDLSGTPPDVTYTPDPDFTGSDLFTYTANDGGSDSNIASVYITVTPPSVPPDACEPVFYVNPNSYPDTDFSRDADWQAAVGNFTEFDLNNFGNGSIVDTLMDGSLIIDVGSSSYDGSSTAPYARIFWGAYSGPAGGIYGTVSGGALLNYAVRYTDITFSFSVPVFGFGAWVFDNEYGYDNSFLMTVTEVGGTTYTSDILESGNGTPHFVEGWLAAASTVGITSVSYRVLDRNDNPVPSYYFELDHIQVAQTAPVPLVEAGPYQTAYEGEIVSLTGATFTDPGPLDMHTATIDWDDGTVEAGAVSGSCSSGAVSGSHSYLVEGTYTVEVCVTDDDGGTGCDSFEADILPTVIPPPTPPPNVIPEPTTLLLLGIGLFGLLALARKRRNTRK